MSELKKDEMGRVYSIIMYLNKKHKAYGIGYNQDYVFTKKYKKGWKSKPVLLMNNAKHVYAVYGATLILDRTNNLYWSGKQGWYSGYDWIKKCR